MTTDMTTTKFDTKASAQRTYERVLRYVRDKLDSPYGFDVQQEVLGVPSPKSKKAPLVDAMTVAEQAAWRTALAASQAGESFEARTKSYKDAFEQQAQALAEQFGLTYKPVGTKLRA